MAVLGYLAKLERGLGLAFGARFQHDFSIIMFSIQWTKFQYHISFLSQDIKHNVLLSSYLDSRCRHKLIFFLNQPLKEWLTGKKRGEDKNTKT